METFRAIFDHLPQPCMAFDDRLLPVRANRAAMLLFNGSASRGGKLVVPPWLAQELEAFSHSGETERIREPTVSHPNGRRSVYRLRLAQVADQGLVAIVTDITERRRALEEIGRLAAIVNSSDDAIASLDLFGRFTAVNAGLEAMYGWDEEALLGMTVFDLVAPGREEEMHGVLRDVALGRSVKRVESLRRRRNGVIFPVSTTYSPIVCYDEVIGVSAISRDITERKRAERDLLASRERLRGLLSETVGALSAAQGMRDLYTAEHQERTACIACAVGRGMGLDEEALDGLRTAALLHDIGKMCVPMSILSKPGGLHLYEMELIRQHPRAGFEALRTISFPRPVARIVLEHHERLDGSGYPDALRGDEVLLESRILAVADVLEAMTSHRPYRPARPLTEALEFFRVERGRLFDPYVCDALGDCLAGGVIPPPGVEATS